MSELSIKRAVIEVNGGCNYSCSMCPQSSPGRSKNFLKKLSLENFYIILEQLGKVETIQLEGSGEATLMSDLPDYISLARKYADNVNIFTNGFRLRGDYMKRCVDSGLTLARFSIIGYDKHTYKQMMNIDAFELVKQNAIEMRKYGGTVASYHLILDQTKEEWEIEQYKTNFIDPVQSQGMIWRQHNWSGVYNNPYKRKGLRKTCGRPFADEITIRAGGLAGKWGAVHPCCQVLGRDDEAVLGHVQEQSISDIFNGNSYNKLREAHASGKFDTISYCKDCDFLTDDSEVLVYNSVPDFKIRQMLSTTVTL